jgi:hypothetical protein
MPVGVAVEQIPESDSSANLAVWLDVFAIDCLHEPE